jgi:class 3 adenylate cyclase
VGIFAVMADGRPRSPLTPVTVLFADITGSVTLYAEHGDATAFALASDSLGAVERDIAAGGGRVVKRLGDGVLAVFAQPSEALRAAVAARAALADPDMTARGEGVRLRFGISCGEAVLAADDVFGDVVNVAARLVGLAGAEEIFLSGKAYEGLAPELRGQMRLIDQLLLRNRPGPILVYEFIGDECDSTVGVGARLRTATAVMEVSYGDALFVLGPERPRLTIGRQAEHDIRIEHEAVSRLQAEVVLRGDKFVLVDHSTNGTYVQLEHGPMLRLIREELALAGSGRIVAGVDSGPPILFRFASS